MSTGSECSDIPLVFSSSEFERLAVSCAEKYGLSLCSDSEMNSSGGNAYLYLDAEGLALVNAANTRERIMVDFLGGRSGYRLATMSNTAQPVLKAVGFNKEKTGLRVLDATAGMGVDGMTLARAGCNVLLLEKSPVMAAMLEDAFLRVAAAAADPSADSSVIELSRVVAERIRLEFAESLRYFEGMDPSCFDVIYLDPMFPERKKSSKVKKEMQLARFVTDCEDNALGMLEAALATGVRRVVVKRPLKAPLLKKGFSAQIKGKSIRFDVFIR